MAEYSDPREFGFHPETVMTALMPYEQFSSKTRRLILGIDIGIASVGVCLIDIRNHEIILMASHIFKAPVEGKQKDISARPSGASIRRGYRSVRRTTKRRKNRKKVVRDIEKKYVLIPDDADGQWFAIRKDEPDVLHLRGKALLYKLNARELARILYAFAGRRGYIDHGKGTTDDDSGKVKKALSENRKILDENGYETIAQYLLKQPTSRNREGDYRYMVDIEMVTDEIHTIFRHQRDLGSDIATEELEGEYLSALRWLTDTSARDEKIYGRVGYCTYLGAPEKRAASSLISFEMVRAYENMHTRLPVPRDIDLIGAHIIPSFSNETSMHQLKGRHGLTVSLVLSLAVYVQFPLLALDFRHGIQNESSSQRKGGNKHERYG